MLLFFMTALLSLPESTGIPHLLLGSFQLPAGETELLTQQNLKTALQLLGVVGSLPDSLKQSVTQSMGMQALQYSWWWNKTGKTHWGKLQVNWLRFNAWRKGLPQTQVTIAWHWPKPVITANTH
jgi:hypothetical protein